MDRLQIYLDLLDTDYFELSEALKGLKDEHVWRRPGPNLLSIGETVGHIAFWEAIRFAGEGEDPAKCRINSPLIDPRFRYYTTNLETHPAENQLSLGAKALADEIQRVLTEASKILKETNPVLEEKPEHLGGWTNEGSIQYTIFHVAYHTGQIYTIRHLLGEETPDN